MSNILFGIGPGSLDSAGVADTNAQNARVRAGTVEECHSAMRQLLSVIHSLQLERDALRSADGGPDVCRLIELEKEVFCLVTAMSLFVYGFGIEGLTWHRLTGEAFKDRKCQYVQCSRRKQSFAAAVGADYSESVS